MATASELLFVDSSISDLCTIVRNLRPEVEAIVLDRAGPPARQMAAALEGRHELDAVHIMAHGSPGEVSFAAGVWAAETLEREAADLAKIGQALGKSGILLLWSCSVAAGPSGSMFVDALSRATGTPVAGADTVVGSQARGGRWELARNDAVPPLTEAGIANYAGVMATGARGEPDALAADYLIVSWRPYAKANKYQIVANLDGVQTTIGAFVVPRSSFAGRLPVLVKVPGPFTIAGSGAAMANPGNIALFSEAYSGAALGYDTATQEMLGDAGSTVLAEKATQGAGA
jgi:hypothetical protein